MIMTWYLGWVDFRTWKTFPKFLVNKCCLNFDIGCLVCQNLPKNTKKGNCWLKTRGGSVMSCLQPWYLGDKWPKVLSSWISERRIFAFSQQNRLFLEIYSVIWLGIVWKINYNVSWLGRLMRVMAIDQRSENPEALWKIWFNL